MGKPKRSYKYELQRVMFTFMFKINVKFNTSIVVPCRPCSSKRRILALIALF